MTVIGAGHRDNNFEERLFFTSEEEQCFTFFSKVGTYAIHHIQYKNTIFCLKIHFLKEQYLKT